MSSKRAKLSDQKSNALVRKEALETGSKQAQSAITTSHQITNFRQNLQTKLAEAEDKYHDLGFSERDGKVGVTTAQGYYNLGLSPAAFKMMLAVSLITNDVAKDRIIRVHTPKDEATLDTHDFYQITGDSAALVHKHGAPFAIGGKGKIFEALDLVSQEVRILKEMKNPDDEDAPEEVKIEYDMSCAANPDNMRPGLNHKPHACFDLRREGFGGIGLLFDLHNQGDLSKNLSKLTVQDQAQGLLSLFSANQSLSADGLLHLDIKPENVFVHAGTDTIHMVVADFDGLWNLHISADEFVERIIQKNVPENSSNSVTAGQIDHLEALGQEIEKLHKELQSAEPGSEAASVLEQKLNNLIGSYNTTATCAQSWGVAYAALQMLSRQFSKTFKEQDVLVGVLNEKIEQCQDRAEKQFLQHALSIIEPILRAPQPEIDKESGKIKTTTITPEKALQDIQALVGAFMTGTFESELAPQAAASSAAASSPASLPAAAASSATSSTRPEGAALQRGSKRGTTLKASAVNKRP